MISPRAKRIIVYTASLLIAPMPMMPYVGGTREFAFGAALCGIILTLSGIYVVRAEIKLKHRSQLGQKILAASLITLLFGAFILVCSIVYLVR